jgi:hypothetical protein
MMSDPNSFALRLIEAVAPDEIDVAPAMINAYLEGGKSRRALFESSANIPGAFSSAELVIITPVLLHALATAGSLLLNLLSSDLVGDSIAAVKTALELVSTGRSASEFLSSNKKQTATSQVSVITDNLSAEIRGTGLTKAQCDEIALRTLKMLLENSSEAGVLVKVLVESKKK